MQEVFENIIKALEEKRDEAEKNMELSDVLSEVNSYGGMFDALDKAIEIINQTAAEYNNGWIPVSERLPKRYEYVYVTCHSLCDERPNWVADTIYVDTWGIPIVDLGNAEVIAWKKKILPEPYHPKGDEKYAEV